MTKHYFVSFGCWNNGGCNRDTTTGEKTDLSRVMETLNSLPNASLLENDALLSSPPTQIFVSGDNYYPEKVETTSENGVKKK